jgi:hypothetical protein
MAKSKSQEFREDLIDQVMDTVTAAVADTDVIKDAVQVVECAADAVANILEWFLES